MFLKFLGIRFLFSVSRRTRYPRRVSAAKTCPGMPAAWLCSWGRVPNRDRTPTAAGAPAAMIPATDDARQRRHQPRQAERRTHPSPGTMHSRRTRPRWTADRPPPRTTGTQAPPAPPRSTAAPRTQRPATIPATAAGPPHGPPQPHSAPTADARRQPPRRPGRPQDPPRAALLLYIHPSPPTARHSSRQRPTLDRWTASGYVIVSGYMQI